MNATVAEPVNPVTREGFDTIYPSDWKDAANLLGKDASTMFAAFTRGSDTDPSTSDAADIDEVRRMPSSAGSSPERAPRSAGLLEVFDTNETNLYAFGRSLGARVQDLMADTSPLARWEREEASAHELSFHVAEALDKQHKLNQANLGLHGMNYAINIANSATSRRLKAELELGKQRTEQLELEVSRQNDTIDLLNQSVVGLESENRVFEEKTERLKSALGNNTALLNKSLCEFRSNKATYDLAIENQMRMIRSLRSGRVRQDAVVDTVLGLFAAVIVNSTLVDSPLRMLLVLVPRVRLRKWLRQLLKCSTWVLIMKELRKRAVMIGWHNRVGAVLPYVKEIVLSSRKMALDTFSTGQRDSAVEDADIEAAEEF